MKTTTPPQRTEALRRRRSFGAEPHVPASSSVRSDLSLFFESVVESGSIRQPRDCSAGVRLRPLRVAEAGDGDRRDERRCTVRPESNSGRARRLQTCAAQYDILRRSLSRLSQHSQRNQVSLEMNMTMRLQRSARLRPHRSLMIPKRARRRGDRTGRYAPSS